MAWGAQVKPLPKRVLEPAWKLVRNLPRPALAEPVGTCPATRPGTRPEPVPEPATEPARPEPVRNLLFVTLLAVFCTLNHKI